MPSLGTIARELKPIMKRESAATKLIKDKSLLYNTEQRLAGQKETKPRPIKLASDKAYIYQDGKFNIPLEDVDPLQYAGSRSIVRIPPKEITADQAFEILRHNPKELKKAPWAVRHPVLTTLLGTGIGAAGGAGIGAMFKPRGAAAAAGALIGALPGGIGGGLHSGTKTLATLDKLRRQKKIKTAGAAQVLKDMAPFVLIPAGVGGAIGAVAEPRSRKKDRFKARMKNVGIGALVGGILGLGPGAHYASERAAQRLAQNVVQAQQRIGRQARNIPPSTSPFGGGVSTKPPGGGAPSWPNFAGAPPKPPAGGFGGAAPSTKSRAADNAAEVTDWLGKLNRNPDVLKAHTKFNLPIDPTDIKAKPLQELKQAYRQAAKKAHPDKAGGSEAMGSAVNQWKTFVEDIRKEKLASAFENAFFAEIHAILSL